MSVSWTITLLLKVTLLLAIGLIVDRCFARRKVLAVAAFWDAVYAGIALLLPAALVFPSFTALLLPPAAGEFIFNFGHSLGAAGMACAATVYGAGVAISAVHLLTSWRALRRLRRNSIPVISGPWRERLSSWESRLGFARGTARRPIRLLQSNEVDVPVALGVWRRAIVIPSRMAASTPRREAIDAILVHELAHLERADFAWQLGQRVVRAGLWFHPLAWVAERRAALVRERACDELVVHATGDAPGYAELLLDLASIVARRPALALGVAAVGQQNLPLRLVALQTSVGHSRCQASVASRLAVFSLVTTATVLLATLVIGRMVAGEGLSSQTPPFPPATLPDHSGSGDSCPELPADCNI